MNASSQMSLGLRITGDASSAKQASAEAEQAVKRIGPAAAEAGNQATTGLGKVATALDAATAAATTAGAALAGAGAAGAGAMATTAAEATAMGAAVGAAGAAGAASLTGMASAAQGAGARIVAAAQQGQAALTALDARAQATGRNLAQALGMHGSQTQLAALDAAKVKAEAATAQMAKLGTNSSRAWEAFQRMGAQGSAALAAIESQAAGAAGGIGKATGTGAEFVTALKQIAVYSVAAFAVTGVISFAGAVVEAATKVDSVQRSLLATAGSATAAAESYAYVRQVSGQLGLETLSAAKAFAQLQAAAQGTELEGQKTRDIFAAVSKASAALGLSADETSGALLAIGQMMSKGTVASEELRGQLGERLPGAFNTAARAMGVTTAELGKMLEKGDVIAADFLPRFAAELDKTYAKARFDSIQGNINRITNAWEEFKASVADQAKVAAGIDAVAGALQGVAQFNRATPLLQAIANNALGGYSLEQLREGRKLLLDMGLYEQANSQALQEQILKLAKRNDMLKMSAAPVPVGQPDPLHPGGFRGGAIVDGRQGQKTLSLEEQSKQDVRAAEALDKAQRQQLETLRDQAALTGVKTQLERTEYQIQKQGLDQLNPVLAENMRQAARQVDIKTAAIEAERKGQQEAKRAAMEAKQARAEANRDAEDEFRRQLDLSNRKIESTQREMEGEKALELIRAGDDPAQRAEIERRYAENALVITKERINSERQLRQNLAAQLTDQDKFADNQAKLAGLELDLDDARNQTKATTDALTVKEQARLDLTLQQMRTAADDSQVLAALARQLAAEGKSADEIGRQLDLKSKLLELERQFPGNQQVLAAAATTAQAKSDQDRAVQEARDRAQDVANAWQQATRRIDDAFAQMWQGVISGQRTAGDIIKSLFTNLLAELAHAAITRPIEIAILTGLGAPSGTASAAFGSGGGIFSLLGLGGAGVTGAASGAAGGTGLAGYVGMAAGGTPLLTGMTSPWAAGMGLRLGSALGLSGSASSYLGLAGYYSPWGAVAGLAANMLGLKGESPVANAVLPTVGGLAGGALGGAAAGAVTAAVGGAFGAGTGAAAGAAAGPIGAVIGAIIGAIASMAFNAAKPHGGAAVTYGADNAYATTYLKDHAGSAASNLVGFGQSMAPTIAAMERAFGVELGKFTLAFEQKDRNIYFRGYDDQGQFSSLFSKNTYSKDGKLSEAAVKDKLDQLAAAVLKRDKVLAQIDDGLVRGLVSTSDRLTEIQAKYKLVANIRAYEGERDSLGAAADKLLNDYIKYQNRIQELTGGVNESVELEKLAEAFKRQFAAQAQTVRDSLASLSGTDGNSFVGALKKIDDAARQIAVQNEQLVATAKRAGDAASYTPISQAEIEAARQAALVKAQQDFLGNLRQLAGAAAPLSVQIDALAAQFKGLAADAAAAGVSTQTLGAVLAAQYAGLVQSALAPLLEERGNIAALRAQILGGDATAAALASAEQALAANTNAQAELGLIGQVRQVVEARYQSELSRLQALQSAYQRLADYVDGLKQSDLSPLTPAQKLGAAGRTYADTLSKAQANDATALSNFPSAADAYLKEAQGRYASGAPYQAIFKRVLADTSALGAKAGSVTADIAALQQSTLGKLDGLDTKVGTQIQSVGDKLAAGVDAVANLLNGPDGSLASALKGFIAFATGATATPAAVAAGTANFSGQAGTAITANPAQASAAPALHGAEPGGLKISFDRMAGGNSFTDANRDALNRYLRGLDTSGYNAADWALWAQVGQQVEARSQAFAAGRKDAAARRAHDVAANINALLPQDLRFFGEGGWAAPGWAVVGERGPELVNFSDPARVYTAAQTSQALRHGGADPASPALAEELRRLIDKLADKDDRANRQLMAMFGQLLQAVQDSRAISEATGERIAREVRLGLAKRAA